MEEQPGPTGLDVAFRSFVAANGATLHVAVTQAADMGGTGAANAVVPLITAYGPKCLAMSGVCAGRSGDANLGDVIVGDRLWTHDTGEQGTTKRRGHRQGGPNSSRPILTSTRSIPSGS